MSQETVTECQTSKLLTFVWVKQLFTRGIKQSNFFLSFFLSLFVFAAATKWTFHTCGAIGPEGPTQNQCNIAYRNSNVNVTVGTRTPFQGIQSWIVPETGEYRYSHHTDLQTTVLTHTYPHLNKKKQLSRGKNAGDNHCFFVHDRVRDSHYSITLLMTPVFTMRGDMREKAHTEVKMKDFQVNLQSKMGSEKTQSWLVY